MPPRTPFRISAETTAVLNEAYHKITNQFRGNNLHYDLYDYIRMVMCRITPLNTFFVALLKGHDTVCYPYGWEDGEFSDPVSYRFTPNGQTAWLLRNKRTYRFAYDNGVTLNAGVRCGDVTRTSADAMTVPLLHPSDRNLIGMMSAQSYTPHTFDQNAVRAFEWLADLVSLSLTRDRESRDLISQLDTVGDITTHTLTSGHVLEYLSLRFRSLRETAAQVLADEHAGPDDIRAAMSTINEQCARIQSELVEMSMHSDSGPHDRFRTLTPVEQEIGVRLAKGASNQDLVDELGVSINTVKSHVRSILRKYGMSDRTQVAMDIRRHLGG
jgi:DNA-binding CsgD family transcriptional regulator